MLSIAKVADADYYLKAVVSGIEGDYAIGEEPGRWTHTHELLGIDGELEPAQLTAVLAGRHPITDAPLNESANRKIPAFDLTFRAPKSVSLAFALGSPEMTAEITAAHDAAVDAALGYLERTAAVSRRGHNGTEQVSADGFIAAAFRHRTSRAADPHLHTHALVPNMVRSSDDGRWRTLDARHLYAHSLTAGYVYESHLRDELTRRLGVAWGPIINGLSGTDEGSRIGSISGHRMWKEETIGSGKVRTKNKSRRSDYGPTTKRNSSRSMFDGAQRCSDQANWDGERRRAFPDHR